MVLVILRHSQSTWNKENKFTGWTDVSLSNIGINESIQAGKILKNYNFDNVFTSNLKRTIETYNIIQKEIDLNLLIRSSHSLNERDYGDLTGKNKDELKEIYGEKQIQEWRRSYTSRPPNGENLEDVKIRAGNYFDSDIKELLDLNKNILIISHGNTLRALFVHFELYDSKSVESLEIPTGVPIEVDLKNKKYFYKNLFHLKASQILDSRGYPTIEVKCINNLTGKCLGKGECPSGSSCGSNEALELRDGDPLLFQGKSVLKAIENINILNEKLILNEITVTNLKLIDSQMKAIDNSFDKSLLGGNVFTAVSFCMMNVGANLLNMEMYEYISYIYEFDNTYIIKFKGLCVCCGGGVLLERGGGWT
jgi:2,3-bisphosphoglycerate-dependent phosphoglycerate mutase